MRRKTGTRFLAACGVAALFGAGLANGPAVGATASDTFQVTADVVAGCTIAAGDLAFGTYDPFGADLDATSTINVTCTNLAPWEIQLNGGGSGNVNARQMSGTLNYQLFSNSGRTVNWGETLGSDTRTGTGTGALDAITVYGRIPGGQNGVPVGAYNDTINATINF